MCLKRLMVVVVLFLLALSIFVSAQNETADNCSSLWGSIKCFLWGNPENRAGMSWWARGEVLVV